MKTATQDLFVLDNFEGPLDFLLHLIQQDEIPIHEVDVHLLTAQFLSRFQQVPPAIDVGAEFVGSASFLIWLKSKALLPQHEQTEEEGDTDPRFAIIHQLLDYCRFKEAAKSLEEREVCQSAYYPRGLESSEVRKNLGIEHLSLQDLASLFQQLLAKVDANKGSIQEEEWKVSDKIEAICRQLAIDPQLPFEQLFADSLSRLELIVTFLALLELMKRGSIRVVRYQNKVIVSHERK